MEPLVELPVEKWQILQKKLKNLWPLNVPGYNTLYINLKNSTIRDALQFRVYCPFGDMDNGLVAIIIKPNGSQECILFSTTEDTRKLGHAVAETKLIDWTRKVCIGCATSIILDCLNNIRGIMDFSMYDIGLTKTFFLDCKSKPFEDIRLPMDTQIAPIKPEHLQHVDEEWPFKYPGSLHYYSILASNGMSYGLYSGDKLLAWVFLNEYYYICHLYCEEEHRRKGFAEFLLKYLINEQLKEGNNLYAYVCEGNKNPVGLFNKLGFVSIDDSAWVMVKK